jgi:hypothetical protein
MKFHIMETDEHLIEDVTGGGITYLEARAELEYTKDLTLVIM